MERLEKSVKENAQAIQSQQTAIDENTEGVKNLQVQMVEVCSQLREVKEILLLQNNRGDQRLFRLGRLDFPKFNGEDPEGWLYKCNHFFSEDKTPANMKLHFAVINLEGIALQWHQGFITSQVGRIM